MSNPFRQHLEGRTAIVTGGSSGIGRATCLALADAGVNVVVVGTNHTRIDEVVSAMAPVAAGGHLGLALDVRDEAEMRVMAERTLERFGRIDILVACAGILRPPSTPPKPLAQVSLAEWKQVVDINLKGAFLSNRAVLPAMIEQRRGDIINVSSVSGLKGRAHDAPYCASKFGMMGMTASLAEEVRNHGIRVQAAVPDAVDTPIWQQNAPVPIPAGALSPDRVALLLLFMLALPEDSLLVSPVIAPFVSRRRAGREKTVAPAAAAPEAQP